MKFHSDRGFSVTLEQSFGTIRTTPQGATNTGRGLTLRIDLDDWRAVMDSTQDNSANFRTPARWNSVPVPERVARRALENIEVQDDGCWLSRYSVASHGYAQIGWQDKGDRHVVLAHRAAWVAINGQMPMGVTLDHLCKVRRCVNPEHLRMLSNMENARRNQGDDFPMGGCRHGHPNTALVSMARKTKTGERRWGLTCGQCMKDSRARWVERNPDKLRKSQSAYSARRWAAQVAERAN